MSDGGDLYTWGAGRHGQLGHIDFKDQKLPKLNMPLQVSVGCAVMAPPFLMCTAHCVHLVVLRRHDCGDHCDAPARTHTLMHTLVAPPTKCILLAPSTTDSTIGAPPPPTLQKLRTQLAAVGFQHSAAVTDEGKLLTWGHAKNGRLGLGTLKRNSVPPPFNRCFPEPSLVTTFAKIRVKQVRDLDDPAGWRCRWGCAHWHARMVVGAGGVSM